MRNRFDEQLFELNREIIEMGATCEEVIAAAVEAFMSGNIKLAHQVKKDGASMELPLISLNVTLKADV